MRSEKGTQTLYQYVLPSGPGSAAITRRFKLGTYRGYTLYFMKRMSMSASRHQAIG